MNIKYFKIWWFITVVCLLSSCTSISAKTYNLTTPLVKGQNSITIVLISDLHNTTFGKDQTVLIDMIKDAHPDLIILSGDIYDRTVPMNGRRRQISSEQGVHLLLSEISGIAPVYYVTGNHEYKSRNIKAIRNELESYGATALSDNYIETGVNDNIIIMAGVEDPFKKRYETPDYNQFEVMEKAFRKLDEVSLYKILVAHRPEMINTYKKYSFDLVLSGHAHGGQVIIPKIINGLYSPHQGFFPKYAGGLYRHGNLTHIVSRGLTYKHPRLPRIFNPPELVIIIIKEEPY
jgi:predicted MPP superfamily phosphohydrolase